MRRAVRPIQLNVIPAKYILYYMYTVKYNMKGMYG